VLRILNIVVEVSVAGLDYLKVPHTLKESQTTKIVSELGEVIIYYLASEKQ
jgi:hypothetical protein